jgi:hypothetical protein
MSSTVKSIAYVHTADIDPTVVKSGATLEGLANICVTAAEKALEAPPKGYTHTAQLTHGHVCLDEGDAPFDPGAGRARRRETRIGGCVGTRAASA